MNDKILRAKKLATEGHAGQFRKFNGEPYITHPIKVHDELVIWMSASNLEFTAEQRCTMECAAYGHDIIEDCPHITEIQIISATDVNTLKLINELTNPSKNSKASRADRKKIDRDHLKNVSWEAKIIKLIDRACNLLDMAQCPDKDFIKLYLNESTALLECLRNVDHVLEKKLSDIIDDLTERLN